jgi:hypothetical protein
MVGKTLVLGFGHKCRQGKNAAADFIHQAYPSETRIFSFAGALRTYCRLEHGMTGKDAPLLQRVGLEMRERRGPNVWVDLVREQILEEQPEVALLADMRFPNEAAFCDAAIKVTRIMSNGHPYVSDDRPADHPSETALDDYDGWYDVITVRDGDMNVLWERAVGTYRNIRLDERSGLFTPAAQEAA